MESGASSDRTSTDLPNVLRHSSGGRSAANLKIAPRPEDPEWYSVRCVFLHAEDCYEERITLWKAAGFDEAIALAEDEAKAYASALGSVEFVGLSQAYALADAPDTGAEVFSLIRESDLRPKEYLDRFFDTGGELQQHWRGDAEEGDAPRQQGEPI